MATAHRIRLLYRVIFHRLCHRQPATMVCSWCLCCAYAPAAAAARQTCTKYQEKGDLIMQPACTSSVYVACGLAAHTGARVGQLPAALQAQVTTAAGSTAAISSAVELLPLTAAVCDVPHHRWYHQHQRVVLCCAGFEHGIRLGSRVMHQSPGGVKLQSCGAHCTRPLFIRQLEQLQGWRHFALSAGFDCVTNVVHLCT